MSDFVSSIGQGLSNIGSSVGNFLSNPINDIGIGLAAFTGGASLALDAGTVAAADGIALSTYGVPAAQAMADYGISAEALGLPAAATAADVGAVAGTASADFAGSAAGQEAIGMTAQAGAGGAGSQAVPFQLADGSMGSIQNGNIVDAAGNVVAQGGGQGLQSLLGTAKTGAQLVGGLGQIAGGARMLGGTGVKPQQASPFAQYQPGLAAQLNQLLTNPQTITSTPGFQFQAAQGLEKQQAAQAAQGNLVSGGALLQANQYGQNFASNQYQQQLQNLASLTGATQSPGAAATAQQNIAQSNVGQFAGGLSALATGAQGVLNPLQTLYSQYNQSSPSVT